MDYKNKSLAIYLPFALALIFIAGIFVGRTFTKGSLIEEKKDKLTTIFQLIANSYVDEVSFNDLVEKSIPRILEGLDPHTIYISASELNEINEPLEGNFDGIGIQFNIQKDTVVVVNTIQGGPSEKVGLLAGDRIVMVNDSLIVGKKISNEKVMKLLKGKSGTIVKLGIKRKNIAELVNFEITRGQIPLVSVDVAYMINDKTGYVKINKFSRTTYQEFRSAIFDLKDLGMKNLILDLRGNTGGYMDAATRIADEFLPKGKLIVYTKGQHQPKRSIYATSANLCLNLELAVLIDHNSASASEILAGAIQDNDRGTILGLRSFGKGLVGEQIDLPDGSAIRMTVSRYYTPVGRSVQKPYGENPEDYIYELETRFLHGEMITVDSTQFADSLKFVTPKGKIVYGGGGIMPDIFVPVDTTGFSDYYYNVSNKGLIYKFGFDFTDNNRGILNKFENHEQVCKYLNSIGIFNKFIEYAEKNGVKANAEQIEVSKEVLDVFIKGFIVRNILDDKGFYPVINKIDKTINEALMVF
ncbi:MAG: S41 family peptidase [Bacteroidales bacterium]|nr:S41 family peptidase [Bacteroidales bacterium]